MKPESRLPLEVTSGVNYIPLFANFISGVGWSLMDDWDIGLHCMNHA